MRRRRRRPRSGKSLLLNLIFWIVYFYVNFFWVFVKVLYFLLKTLFSILIGGVSDFIKLFAQSTKSKNYTPENCKKKSMSIECEQYIHKDYNDKHLSPSDRSMDFNFANHLDNTEKFIEKNTTKRDFVTIKEVKIFTGPGLGKPKEYATTVIPQLLAILPQSEIENLQNTKYCNDNRISGTQYPVISKRKEEMFGNDEKFRAYPHKIAGFWVTAQWYSYWPAWKKYLQHLERTIK